MKLLDLYSISGGFGESHVSMFQVFVTDTHAQQIQRAINEYGLKGFCALNKFYKVTEPMKNYKRMIFPDYYVFKDIETKQLIIKGDTK